MCNPGTPFKLIKSPVSLKNAQIYNKQMHVSLQGNRSVVIVTEACAERSSDVSQAGICCTDFI